MSRTTGAAFLAAALLLTGCSGADTDATAGAAATPPGAPTTEAVAQSALLVSDGWIRAQPDEGASMTGVFAVIDNTTDAPITITGASTSLGGTTELHEVVHRDGAAVMQEIDGGFVVEPGSSHTLEPGGDHLMVMGMTEPLMPGEVVTVTLETDAEPIEFEAVAKTFSEGDERYHENESPAPTGDMGEDHGEPTDEATS